MKLRTIACLLLSTVALFSPAVHAQASKHWVASWASSQQAPEPANVPPAGFSSDATLRQAVHLSLGGERVRVVLSNAFGTSQLEIASARLALPVAGSPAGLASGRIQQAGGGQLLFDGKPAVTIPPGAVYVSDPLTFSAPPLSSLVVSLHLGATPAVLTGHPSSRATTLFAHGDQTAAAELTGTQAVDHWYVLSEVDVETDRAATALVALGDSITDGHASTLNGNDRWPDVLAAHLSDSAGARRVAVAVVNEGIGGNHLLTDGLGPNALARLDRDVLAPAGATTVLVLEGINDLGMLSRRGELPAADHAELVAHMIGAYRQIILRAHARGMDVLGGTLTPDVGSDYYHPAAANEADRQEINTWIRAEGHFDGVIDFDHVLADPAHPERLLPAFDCGDHLHPSPAGYRAMGEAAAAALAARSR